MAEFNFGAKSSVGFDIAFKRNFFLVNFDSELFFVEVSLADSDFAGLWLSPQPQQMAKNIQHITKSNVSDFLFEDSIMC